MFATLRPAVKSLHLIAWVVLICTAAASPVWGQSTAAGEAMFKQIDTSRDGVITMDEAAPGTKSFVERVFKELGKSSTDKITREEFLAAYGKLKAKNSIANSAVNAATSDAKVALPTTTPDGIGFIDTNGDDSITRAEWSKFTQSFTQLDANHDNSIDQDEIKATGDLADTLLQLADLNGDGKITRTEWTKFVASFARLDANHDHTLTEAELQTAAKTAVASASGSADLAAGSKNAGPTTWRGPIEGRGQIELVVTGNRIVGRELGGGGNSLGSGTFTMTGDGKQGNMDAVYTEGDRTGQTALGIYRLEGNTLVWCVNNRGGRPATFTPGGGNWLMTLTRVPNP